MTKSLERNGLHFGLYYRMLPLLNVLLVVVVLHIDLLLKDVEEEDWRGVLREFKHLQALIECAHLQLDLVVFHQGDAHLEEVYLTLEDEIIPNAEQELSLEATREYRKEPSYQVHSRLQTDAFEMVPYCWAVYLHQIFEELDSELYLTLFSPVEAQEVIAVDEINEVDYGLVVIILIEDHQEDLTQQQKISDWRQIRPHGYQRFAHLDDVLLHVYVLVLGYALLPLLNVLNNHGVYGQVIADDERPKGFSAGRRKSMLPKRFQDVCFDADSTTCGFLAQSFVLLVIAPAGTNGLYSTSNVTFLLRFSVLVVPMPIPKWKDVVVPHVLNDFIIDSALEFVLKLLSFLLPPLDQNCSQVIDPLPSLSGGPGLEVKRAVGGGDGEAKRIKLLRYFVLLHDL